MSFPRYPAYKQTASAWLDMIPDHWDTSKLKWYSDRYSGGTPDKSRQDYWLEGTIPWLNSGAVNDGLISEPSTFITESGFANSSAKWVPSGALVMALAGQGKTKGTVAQLAIDTTTNQSMAAIVPRNLVAARFLYWWLVSHYQNIRNMSGGDDRDGLNLDLLGSISIPLLPRTEQEQIARFLDRETAKIDALVAEQEQLISLLKEKRQAVISHAVTKGLDPSMPMKDSGFEWLGEVPAHWEQVRLGTMFRQQKRQDYPDLDVLSVYRDFGVVPKGSRTDNFNKTPEKLDAYQLVEIGDLVVNKMKAWQGSLGISDYRGITSPDYVVFSPSAEANPVFIHLLLRSIGMVSVYRSISNGIRPNQWRLEPDSFLALKVCIPPIAEQAEIVAAVTARDESFASLIDEAERSTMLLSERRSVLISAAVTGQIDVRGLATDKEVA